MQLLLYGISDQCRLFYWTKTLFCLCWTFIIESSDFSGCRHNKCKSKGNKTEVYLHEIFSAWKNGIEKTPFCPLRGSQGQIISFCCSEIDIVFDRSLQGKLWKEHHFISWRWKLVGVIETGCTKNFRFFHENYTKFTYAHFLRIKLVVSCSVTCVLSDNKYCFYAMEE